MIESVDIVVCTWNRCELLKRTLESLDLVRRPKSLTVRVVVADNNSTDGTMEVVRGWQGRHPVEYLFVPQQGLSAARNAAMRFTHGDLVAFTDDDVLVGPEWLEKMVDGASTWFGGIYGGPVVAMFESEPPLALVQAFPVVATGFCGVSFDLPDGALEDQRYVFGANMVLRRSQFSSAPFNERLGNSGGNLGGFEETTLQDELRRRGGRVVWLSSIPVRHFVPSSRTTLTYLRRFTIDRARVAATLEGQLHERHPRVDWVLRRMLASYWSAGVGWVLGDKVRCYASLAEAWRVEGVLGAVLAARWA